MSAWGAEQEDLLRLFRLLTELRGDSFIHTDENDMNIEGMLITAFLTGIKSPKLKLDSGSLRSDGGLQQLWFKQRKGTHILLAEWVGCVLVIRSWKRDRGIQGIAYSMVDFAAALVHNSDEIEKEGRLLIVEKPIDELVRANARLLSVTMSVSDGDENQAA